MKKNISILTVFCSVLLSINSIAQNGKGHLFIIGGGNRPDYMVEKIIELAGGKDAKIIIIPMASGEPVKTAEYQKKQLENLGAANVDYILCNNETADSPEMIKKLEGTTGIFFSGGDQSRLTEALNGTKFLESIRRIYYEGGVISGTSAGAAVMSKIMITGDELINKDSTDSFFTIQKGNIKTVEGFGFITDAIIDQHFVIRKRLNRLISVVLEHPELPGIGIDESTAILVNPDNTFQVIGERQVIIFDATNASGIRTNDSCLLSAKNMKMHILISGDKYDLTNKHVIK